ncbi:hypothetical protein [Nonomuraea sp. NPDC049709]|uniref:hypothetical protein n=1 Tax=Nonomuraea sp. NPDC049709 TaxID=3154736 RepID=UPI00341F8ECE
MVDQFDDRLYPQRLGDDADEQTRRAWEHSISGAAERLRRVGFIGLGQERGHVLHEIIRVVWVAAERRSTSSSCGMPAAISRTQAIRPRSPAGCGDAAAGHDSGRGFHSNRTNMP